MNVTSCSGGKREIATAYNSTETRELRDTEVHPRPCIAIWKGYGRLIDTQVSRSPRNGRSGRQLRLRPHHWKTSLPSVLPGCLSANQKDWTRCNKPSWH